MQTTQPPGPGPQTVSETHNVVGEGNDKIHLPKVETHSQAQKLARFLFGPLTRLRTTLVDDKQQVVVSVERNGQKDVLGTGSTVDEALTSALSLMIAANKNGDPISGLVMPARNSTDTVEEKRNRLVVKVAGYNPEDFNGLYPHEVLEVTSLLQLRDTDMIKRIMDKAVIRAKAKKALEAKAKKDIEAKIAELTAKDLQDITIPQ